MELHFPRELAAEKCLKQAGCSKWPRCKARDDPANEAYEPYAAVSREEWNAADGSFSAAG
jgi:hypothetical protein